MGISRAIQRTLSRATPWTAVAEDLDWRQARFSVVDIETTGLSRLDKIVSVGVVEVAGGRMTSNTYYTVVRPERPISAESMCIHALTPANLEDAPQISEVIPRLREILMGSVVVAHAAWIERAFLDRALKPWGERVPDRLVDTAALARHAGLAPDGAREPSLEALSRRLGLPVHTPHHALGDALTTAQLLLALASRMEVAGTPVTVRDLLALSALHSR